MSRQDPLAEAARAVAEPPGEPLAMETLVAWSRGELSPAEREAVEEHLARSPEDAELALALREFGDDLPEEELSPEHSATWDRLAGYLKTEAGGAAPAGARPEAGPAEPKVQVLPFVPPSPRSRPWMAWALAASLLATCVSLSWGIWQYRKASDAASGASVRPNTLIVDLVPNSHSGGLRGSEASAQQVFLDEADVTLTLAPPGDEPLRRVWGRLFDPAGAEIWSGRLQLSEGGAWTLTLRSTNMFRPGLYEIEIDERRESVTEPRARYTFRIAR